MTKYIIAYKKIGEDKWHKFSVCSSQKEIPNKIEYLYTAINNIEKVQIQRIIA